MASKPKAPTNEDLMKELLAHGSLESEAVIQAMRATDRRKYVPIGLKAYTFVSQFIGYGATINSPHMHAHALEILQNYLKPTSKVLDIGSGSGYLTACFARMIHQTPDATGFAVGIEHHNGLVQVGRNNIIRDDRSLIDSGKVIFVEGDGRQGCEEYAPYDCIHVGAAVAEIPKVLIDQLKPGGRMIIPVGPEGGSQYLERLDKSSDGKISRTMMMVVTYPSLTDLKK